MSVVHSHKGEIKTKCTKPCNLLKVKKARLW